MYIDDSGQYEEIASQSSNINEYKCVQFLYMYVDTNVYID
jgi:hypothetical protein